MLGCNCAGAGVRVAFGDDRKPLKRNAALGQSVARVRDWQQKSQKKSAASLARARRHRRPKRSNPVGAAAADRLAREAFRLAVLDGDPMCAMCNCAPATDPHHVLTKQAIKSFASTAGFDANEVRRLLSDPSNGLPLCRYCHDGHHYSPDPRARMRRALIPDSVRAFAIALAGERGIARLERDYPDDQEAA